MKNRLIPLSFEKVLEERGENAYSEQVLLEAINILESNCSRKSSDYAENVFSYKTVRRALDQCLAYHRNNNSWLTYEDNVINYEYAYSKLEKAESILEQE